jgi:hypothetical protein
MPAVARRQMAEPEGLVDAILGALAEGHREITWPRWIAPTYAIQALVPGLVRWGVRRTTLGAVSRKS